MELAVIFMALGFFVIYSVIHFFVLQFTKAWKDRSGYEKFLTIFSIFAIILIIFGQ